MFYPNFPSMPYQSLNGAFQPITGGYQPTTLGALPYSPYVGAGTAVTSLHEIAALQYRIEELRHQIATLTAVIGRQGTMDVYGRTYRSEINGQTLGQYSTQAGQYWGQLSNVNLRESDSHIFLEICLPQLAMGDVEVAISGNRIVCKTRVPVNPTARWWTTGQLPRGFELFELADGRVEFSWLVPVTFQAKEVEASWRETFLCICIPKTDVAARHSVKIVKEAVGARRNASDMNS